MYPKKLESDHLRKLKNVGKHKIKVSFNGSVQQWSVLKKWLIRLGILVTVFALGLIIGRQQFPFERPLDNSHIINRSLPTEDTKQPESPTVLINNSPINIGEQPPLLNNPFSPSNPDTPRSLPSQENLIPNSPSTTTLLTPLTVTPISSTTPANTTSDKNSNISLPPNTARSTPSPPSSTAEKSTMTQAAVTNRLQECENFLNQNQLATGAKGNALTCYQQLLADYPNHPQATAGLQKIETNYQSLIETTLLKSDTISQLEEYLVGLNKVNPQSKLFAQVDRHYQAKIETALSAQQYSEARRYWSELQQLRPNSTILKELGPRLKSATASLPDSQVTGLLPQCQTLLTANHLLSGPNGNAVGCYRQVLALEPGNTEAKAGLKQIEQRYYAWSDNALKKGKLDKARNYLNNLRTINPTSPALGRLQRRLVKLEQAATLTPAPRATPRSAPPSPKVEAPTITPSPKTPASLPVAKSPRPTVPQAVQATTTKKSPAVKKPTPPTESKSPPATPRETPTPPSLPVQPPRCSEIFIQESLGIQPLSQEEKAFKRRYCN